MTKQKEVQLLKKYPKILQDYSGSPQETCMYWGMECGDGWYDLLDDLLYKLQYLCDKFSTDKNEVQVIATQIKEKFGILSFYSHIVGANKTESDIIYDVIDSEERQSKYICEESGEPGVLCSKGGWLRTLSRKEAKKSGYAPIDKSLVEYWAKKDEEESKTL